VEKFFLVGYIVLHIVTSMSNNTGGEVSKNYFCGSDQFMEAWNPWYN